MKLSVRSVKLMSPACAVLLCLGLSAAAQAGAQSERKERVASVRVAYADLDLTQDSDVQILRDRIEKAAYRACGGNPRQHWTFDAMPALTTAAFEECREDAVARTISAFEARQRLLELAR